MTEADLYACAACGPFYDDEGGGKSCVNCGASQEEAMGTDQLGRTDDDCEAGHDRGRCDGAPYCYRCVAEKKKAATEKAKEEGDYGSRELKQRCFNCGEDTEDWDEVGNRQVAVCGSRDCQKELQTWQREDAAAAEEDARADNYERYRR